MVDSSISLRSLETELRGYYAGLAQVAEECFGPGAGRRMLGGTGNEPQMMVELVDVRTSAIGKMLPVWLKYGVDGEIGAGFDADDFEAIDGPLDHLADMLTLLDKEDALFDDCLGGAGVSSAELAGHLYQLYLKVMGRLALDQGGALRVPEIAALADMSERSVRNAVSASENGLMLDEEGRAANAVARRWLAGRRRFKATTRREVRTDLDSIQDSLNGFEIPRFVQARLTKVWTDPDADAEYERMYTKPQWLLKAAREAGIGIERLEQVMKLPLSIRPEECQGLARALKVDLPWFTHQVMVGLFPDQVDMLLNPDLWRHVNTSETPEPEGQMVTIELSEAMLANGYIDLPATSKDLFPEDSFGDRTADGVGGQVELTFGTHTAMTDIRQKSAKTISPRKRFTAWLNSELGAKAGDRMRLEKTGDRTYRLTHITG